VDGVNPLRLVEYDIAPLDVVQQSFGRLDDQRLTREQSLGILRKDGAVERTLIIVKPHAVERGLVGEFLVRFERMGLRIIAARVVVGSGELWAVSYTHLTLPTNREV